MMLSELKKHLMEMQTVSMFELSYMLDTEPEVIRDMLQRWIAKGKVQKVPLTEGCGTACSKCSPLLTEIYEWVGG